MGIIEGIIALVAGVAPLVAKAIGDAVAAGDNEKAAALGNEAIRAYNLDAPELKAGDIAPQEVGPTAFGGIKEDPSLKGYQQKALEQLMAASTGAPTAEDDLAFDEARSAAGQVDTGLRGAAASRAASRGMGGSLQGYVGDLQGAQAGANQAGGMAMQGAADMRRRQQAALAALMRGSTDVRGQEYGMASNKAGAEDALNRFNSGMRFNAAQQSFDNRMGMVRGANAARENEQQRLLGEAGRKRKDAVAWGDAISSGAGAVGDAYLAGEERKRRQQRYDDGEDY